MLNVNCLSDGISKVDTFISIKLTIIMAWENRLPGPLSCTFTINQKIGVISKFSAELSFTIRAPVFASIANRAGPRGQPTEVPHLEGLDEDRGIGTVEAVAAEGLEEFDIDRMVRQQEELYRWLLGRSRS